MLSRLATVVMAMGLVAALAACTSEPKCPHEDDDLRSGSVERPLPEFSGQSIPECPEWGSSETAGEGKERSLTLSSEHASDILLMSASAELRLNAGALVSKSATICGGGVTLVVNKGATFAGQALLVGGGATIVLRGGIFTGEALLVGAGSQVVIVDPEKSEPLPLPAGITATDPGAQAVACYDKNPPNPNMDPCDCYL